MGAVGNTRIETSAQFFDQAHDVQSSVDSARQQPGASLDLAAFREVPLAADCGDEEVY